MKECEAIQILIEYAERAIHEDDVPISERHEAHAAVEILLDLQDKLCDCDFGEDW